MRAMFLAPALLLSIAAFTPASAAPVAPLNVSPESTLIQAQYNNRNHRAAPR